MVILNTSYNRMDVQLSFDTGFMSVSPAVEFFINVLSAQFRGHTEHRMVHRKACVKSEITFRSSDIATMDEIIVVLPMI